MDAIILQILNGLDKGSAYALIALGLTLIFGTLGVVNFAHGALFMIGAFCAVTLSKVLNLYSVVIDPTKTDFLGNALKVKVPYCRQLVWRKRWDDHYKLVGSAGNYRGDSHYGVYWLCHGTRPYQAFLQAPACRSDLGNFWSGYCYAGNYQGVFWRQSDPDTGT